MPALNTTAVVWEGTSPALMAYLVDEEDAAVEQADVAQIAYASYDLERNPPAAGASGPIVVANAVYDTPQTGKGWPYSESGWNFRFVLPASAIPDGGHEYRVEIKLTMTGGEVVVLVFTIEVQEAYSVT